MILLIALLRVKWTYLVLGLLLGAVGVIAYANAHPSHPVEVDGTEASYVEVTRNGSYDHNELQLQGDSNTYNLDKNSFHPTLPDEVFKNGKMQIWIDQGTTNVIAVTLFDENDANPIKYTTNAYDNPSSETSSSQSYGIVAGVIGAILLAIFAVWFVVESRRKEASRSGAGAMPGMAAAVATPQPGSSPGISPDGKWYWDGTRWQHVSDDGVYRWDGKAWIEMGNVYQAKGAPPPPATTEPAR